MNRNLAVDLINYTAPKRKIGRPPAFETEKEFTDAVWDYIDSCKQTGQMPNKAGMRFYLCISHDTWSVYREKFPEAHKEAEDFIENAWVQRLAGTTPTGAIFYLKNAFKEDYRDRHETENTHRMSGFGKDDLDVLLSRLPQEQRDTVYATITTALTGAAVPGGQAQGAGPATQ